MIELLYNNADESRHHQVQYLCELTETEAPLDPDVASAMARGSCRLQAVGP
jgi:hypothetical protein